MGDIYRATDSLLGREVAIKVLAERYAEDDAVRQRFTREALAAARLSGEPNIVTIFDVGEHESRPYIVMEYLAGGSLDDVLREEGAQPPQQAFTWLAQAGRAAAAAGVHVARAGGPRARFRSCARRRPSRREAGEPPARSAAQRARRR